MHKWRMDLKKLMSWCESSKDKEMKGRCACSSMRTPSTQRQRSQRCTFPTQREAAAMRYAVAS
eukprot:11117548-Heterocapsa_arctica.AAC.1